MATPKQIWEHGDGCGHDVAAGDLSQWQQAGAVRPEFWVSVPHAAQLPGGELHSIP
jgi:hypothetical protein